MNEASHIWASSTALRQPVRGRGQLGPRSPLEFRCELCRRPTLILPVCAQCTEAQIEQEVFSHE